MKRLPFLLLGLIAAALAATIARELDNDTVSNTLPTVPRPAPVAAGAPSGPAGPAATGDPVTAGDRIAALLARPLFNPDRRPVPGTAGGSAGVPEPPRLAGILVGPAGRSAIFAGTGEGQQIVLREGGSVGGFTVRAIAPGQVTVLGPTGPRVLRPAFDGAPPARNAARPTARVEAPFERLAAPSGLDILRNAARNAPPSASEGPAIVPGVDQLGTPSPAQGPAR